MRNYQKVYIPEFNCLDLFGGSTIFIYLLPIPRDRQHFGTAQFS